MSLVLPEVSVIVPVYKNHDTLVDLHLQVSTVLHSLCEEFEFVFVDDNCPQNSIAVLRKLAGDDDRVSVVQMKQNVGQQNAVLTGLRYAHGKTAVIMDADLQDPPSALPNLIRKINEGYDVVFAGRRGSYQAYSRLFTSQLYKWALHVLTGVPTDAGLFMALQKDTVQKLLAVYSTPPHLVAMLGVLNLRTLSIPVEREKRPSGESAYTSWMRLKVGLGAAFWALKWKLGFESPSGKSTAQYPVKAALRNKYSRAEL